MATRMQQRRGTAAQWISTNTGNGPILSAGEIGFESDTNKFKIGDGINHWVDLTYFTDADSILSAVSGIVDGAPDLLNTMNELAAALGDDPNFLSSMATKSYVDTAIGNIDALPSQANNSGKYLTTNGSAASWADIPAGYTDENAQDAIGNSVTSGLTYNDSTGAIGLNYVTVGNTLLDGVSGSSYGLIGTSAYLDVKNTNGYNKEIELDIAAVESQLITDGFATEQYVDTAVSGATFDASLAAGAGLDWNASTSQFDVGTLSSPTISSSLTLDGTGDFTISADANIILDATTEVYIGSAASGNEVATKSYADAAAAAIVDSAPSTLNTLNELAAAINDDDSYAATITTALGNKQDKVSGVSDTEIGYLDGVTSAIQTQLDNKAPLESPTFTGTVDFAGATVTGIDALPAQSNNSGKYLTTDGTNASWGTPGPTHKEVFFLSDGYYSHWSIDGLTWLKTSNPGSQDLYGKLNQPGGIASSGSRTVLVNIDAFGSNSNQLGFEVNENFYSPSLKTNVLSRSMGDLVTQFPNLANWDIYGDNPSIKGVASNGNGTFIISFLRSLNFLVSTDNGSTWQMVAVPTPPSGEGEGGGEGSQKPYWNYPTYQFGKFYVTAFGSAGFIESTDGLTWTTVSVPFGMPYSSFEQVYVDAVGNLIAANDQAMGLIYRAAGSSSFSVGYNGLFQYDNGYIRTVGSTFYGLNNGNVESANFRNNSPDSYYNRIIYTSSEIAQTMNFITQTTSDVLYGAYNFATNQHKIGRSGIGGANRPFATSLDTQSDMFGYARSLYIPIDIYKTFTGE